MKITGPQTHDPTLDQLASEHANNPESILQILTQIQAEHGSLTPETITATAQLLGIPAERAFGVASFYSMLRVTPEKTSKQKILRVCDGPACWLCRAEETRHAIDADVENKTGWKVERTSCLGLCDRAPAVLVDVEQAGPVEPDQAAKLINGWRGNKTSYAESRPGEVRVMMARAGVVDPDSITSALEHGAYTGLTAVLRQPAEEVLKVVEASGLTGRGGAGFPVGRKWRFVAQAERTPKIVICNADESEPLIFKDRVLIDSDPHQLLEGMAIAGYATGANEAFIYIRGEYQSQAQRLEQAIQQAEEVGWLGEYIQGSDFSFKIHVHIGAGAYICGEETALIESLEGKRGEPRNRPPYPPTSGYHLLPTLVNNVESFCAVPAIINHGAAWYRAISNYTTPGTKIYMLLGHIQKPGLFEAPYGLTLRRIIDEFGGGMRPGSTFHFALTGGAAGTIVPSDLLDIPMDYASAAKGVSLGAGAFLICDQSVSPVAFLRQLMAFFQVESCGKCTPCRLGTERSLKILDQILATQGNLSDVHELLRLAEVMQVASFCGLGQSVAIPVKSTLIHFSDAFVTSRPAI